MVTDVMRAKRGVGKYKGDNIYLVLAFDDEDRPYSLDISISGEVINHDQGTLSNIDAMAALVSLAIREYDIEYVIGELFDMARGPQTLPAIIGDFLLECGL